MKNMEKKINDLEHIVRSTDEYIKYTKHTTDVVYLNYMEGLLRMLVAKERYEEAEMVRRNIQIIEKRMKEDMENIK